MRKITLAGPLILAAMAAAGAPTAGAANTPRCTTADLAGAIIDEDAGAGNRFARLILTNTSTHDCHTKGFIGGQLIDADGAEIATHIVRSSKKPKTVLVRAGAAASARLHWTVVPSGKETSCPTAPTLAVTPPDETTTLPVYFGGTACGGRIDVDPLRSARPIGN